VKLPEPPLDTPKRLAIMILLERHVQILFVDLIKAVGISKGSIDSHIRVLESYKYVEKITIFQDYSARVCLIPTTLGLRKLQEAKMAWKILLED
jgi:DNA-binding MarR family transcriptional regulator